MRASATRVSFEAIRRLKAVDRMTLDEKLLTMEALWEDLCRQEEKVPVPDWQKEILKKRAKLVKEGKARFVDWEDAKKRIAAAPVE
jgi:hypothetical protein